MTFRSGQYAFTPTGLSKPRRLDVGCGTTIIINVGCCPHAPTRSRSIVSFQRMPNMANFQVGLDPVDPAQNVTAETLYVTDANGAVLGTIPSDPSLTSLAFAIDDPSLAALVAGCYVVDSNDGGDAPPSPIFPLAAPPTPAPTASRSVNSFTRLPESQEARRGNNFRRTR